FSSRRRHTRCYRDWSSDVCSSDLSPREAASQRRCLDGEGHRPPTPRAVPGGARSVRSRVVPQAGSRDRPEVAGDMRPSPGAGGERLTFPPDQTRRFLPSVDRLEAAMHAARNAFERGNADGALGQLAVALKLKPQYDAAWILRGRILR